MIAERVVTTTTRLPRSGEVDGIDYYFERRDNFLKRLEQHEFLEHAQVYDHFYGVSKAALAPARYIPSSFPSTAAS